jgi:DNA repair exonuclease SbcCD nuclease subunit
MSDRAPSGDVVVVHSSDLHVDDGYTARVHGGDGTRGLAVVLEAAIEAAADVVLLAGDIFEHNRLPLDLLDRATRLLGDAALPVVILPGNHDPLIAESAYRRSGVADPANVHVLGVTDDEAVVLPGLELEIWGRAHRDYADMAPLGETRRRTTRWQIAAAHGHYEAAPDMTTTLRPSWLISDAEIAATGADYVALGHWNQAVRVGNGSVPAYYSGSPELARTVNVVRLAAGGEVEVTRRKLNIEGPTSDTEET